MDDQQQSINQEPKSFGLYTGKVPLLLQIIGGLMWLGGIGMIIGGIPLLIFFGLGAILIVFGVFNIKYARAIFKMQKKAYKGTLVLQSITIVGALIYLFISGFSTDNIQLFGAVAYSVLVMFTVYSYRNRLVNIN